jgi:hypothetical protein
MANLKPDELPIGEIDRQMLRDKFTGRSNLFFNQRNAGGTRQLRTALQDPIPNMELDPAVLYRSVPESAYQHLLQTGLIQGNMSDYDDKHRGFTPDTPYFSQGVNLASYASRGEAGRGKYVIATLGKDWRDRHASNGLTDEEQQVLNKGIKKLQNFSPETRQTLKDISEEINRQQLNAYPKFDKKTNSYIWGTKVQDATEADKTKLQDLLQKLHNSKGEIESVLGTYLANTETHRTHPSKNLVRDLNDIASETILQTGPNIGDKAHHHWTGMHNGSGAMLPDDLNYGFTSLMEGITSPDGIHHAPNLNLLQQYTGTLSKFAEDFMPTSGRTGYNPNLVVSDPARFLRFDGLDEESTRGLNPLEKSAGFLHSDGTPVRDSTRPILDSYYTHIQPELRKDIVRLGADDDSYFTSPEAVKKFLDTQHLTQTFPNRGDELPMRQLDFMSVGGQGAMYSEKVPSLTIQGDHIDPRTGKPREWSMPANSINANSRPMAVFRMHPDLPNGFELLHEFNNDELATGIKPIPIGAPRPNVEPDALRRWAEEMVVESPFLSGLSDAEKNAHIEGVMAKYSKKGIPSQKEIDELKKYTESNWGKGDTFPFPYPYPIKDPSTATPAQLRNLREGEVYKETPYRFLQNAIEESTKGSPTYGRKGFVDMNLLTQPLQRHAQSFANVAKGVMEKDEVLEIMQKGFSNPEHARNFATNYTRNPATRAMVNAEMGASAIKFLGKAGAVAGIVTAPSSAVERRDRIFADWATNNRGYPNLVQNLGMRAQAGMENALAIGTMGISDEYLHPEWREPMEPVQRGYYSDNGQRVPNWVPNLQSTLLAK